MKGTHIIADLYECEADLDNPNIVEIIYKYLVEEDLANILKYEYHKFEPQGLSAIYFLAESHFSFHTWPEKKYVSLDYYTCKQDFDVSQINKYIEFFQSKNPIIVFTLRGTLNKLSFKKYQLPFTKI